MSRRIIPLVRHGAAPSTAPGSSASGQPLGLVRDTLLRPMHDLRISVTDRCNFRCTYCMPRAVFDKDYSYVPHGDLLSFEEIAQLARLFVAHGVAKIRLTGGEPLLRRDIHELVGMLAQLRAADGTPLDLTLTTNGSLLERMASPLAAAGLKRVTVSLDALDETIFQGMNDAEFRVESVLRGIDAALDAGLGPIKINMVVQRGINENQILPMARYFRGSGQIVRFIEYMDVGTSNGWRMEQVLPSAEVVSMIDREMPIEPVDHNYPGEVAQRWRYRDGGGEIGVISSVTRAFCQSCTRARLSPDGQLYTCLFASQGTQLRELLRGGASELEISGAIASIWRQRSDRYSELRGAATASRDKVEMSYIGG